MTTVSTASAGRTRRTLLLVATALAAASGAVPLSHAADTSTQKTVPTRAGALDTLSPSTRAYVKAIMRLTPAQLAAGFGTDKLFVGSSRQAVLDSLSPASQRYVKAIIALTPGQLAAGAAGGW